MTRTPSSVYDRLQRPPERPPGHRRSLVRRLRATIGAASLALVWSSACGDDPPPPTDVSVDAGPACERGTLNCGCIGGSGCQDDLLCIAGRCSLTEESPDEAPPPRPRPPPDLELPDLDPPPLDAGGSPPAASDAGAADASVADGPDGAPSGAGDDAG